MTKFTPGPWWTDETYGEDEGGIAIIAANTDCGPLPGNPTRGMVAFAHELLIDRAKICQANARLIAAAPDMYAALQLFIIGANVSYVTALEIARAAIAKADGATT